MLDNGKLSVKQFTVLVFLYTVGSGILILPSGLAASSKQDAWIGALAGVAIGCFALALYAGLWKLFPGRSFAGMCSAVFGRWVGGAVAWLFAFYGFIGAATVLFYVGNFFKTQFLPQTPLVLINALIALVIVMALRLGLETIGRTAELLLPWFLVLLIVLTVTLLPQAERDQLRPVFESGWMAALHSGLDFAGTAYFPLVFLTVLFPSVRNPGQARYGLLWGALLAGGCIVLVTLLCILILGPEITAKNMYPSYALAKKINIGHFFQRVEAAMAGLWFVSTFIKTTLYFYGCLSSASELLKLRQARTLTLPLGMLLVVVSLLVYPNVVYMQNWDSTVFLPYILTMAAAIPLLLLLGGWLKQRLGAGTAGSS